MEYYELVCTTMILEDIKNVDVPYYINKNISMAMLLDNNLKILHKNTDFKYYTFSNFYPIEKGKTYEKSKIYVFNIRSIDLNLIMKLRRVLNIAKLDFKILATQIKKYKQKHVTEIFTLTPVVSTIDKRYWTSENSLEDMIKNICKNTVRKYNKYYKTNMTDEYVFVDGIIKTNQKPIKIPYKNTSFIGNKFRLIIKTDKISQDLAYFAISVGILEKNSAGCGYCTYK